MKLIPRWKTQSMGDAASDTRNILFGQGETFVSGDGAWLKQDLDSVTLMSKGMERICTATFSRKARYTETHLS